VAQVLIGHIWDQIVKEPINYFKDVTGEHCGGFFSKVLTTAPGGYLMGELVGTLQKYSPWYPVGIWVGELIQNSQ
jgi:hypothetical protein